MATVTSAVPYRIRVSRIAQMRGWLWTAILTSRLVALAGGVGAATLTTRVQGWQQFDVTGISLSLGRVGNVLAASSVRWDSIHYLTIAQHGYTTKPNTVFYPLYPLLIHVLSWFIGSDVLAGVLISTGAFLVAMELLYRLAREELGERAAGMTVLLLAFAPLSFFFTAVYTESLFLALSVGVFYLARRQQFTAACVAAAAITLTHEEGIILAVPLAFMYWQSRGGTYSLRALCSRQALPLFLAPLALAGFFIYLHLCGFGWLAPLSNESGYHLTFVGPLVTFVRAVQAATLGAWQTVHGTAPLAPALGSPFSMGFQAIVYLLVLCIALVTLALAWRRLPRVYAIYATVVLCFCTSAPVTGDPLHAFDRYALVIFPLWMVAGDWLSRQRSSRYLLLLSGALLFFYSVQFGRWVFVG